MARATTRGGKPRIRILKATAGECCSYYFALRSAEKNYSLGLAVLERSRDEGKALPERLARHHASFALTLLKLERPDDAKRQALQAIHSDGLEGIKDWIEVLRFADAFTELLSSSQIASMSEDRSESVPVKHMSENPETGDEVFGTPHAQESRIDY
ncbi:hypothetical protein RRF57_011353 [Xylaria bambusicola]|uniref:Uncharacterized protein n=1 Tax=Xylaria bambusicola TaxID=326684 RepID=A0AAN7UYY0_9PEZI